MMLSDNNVGRSFGGFEAIEEFRSLKYINDCKYQIHKKTKVVVVSVTKRIKK